MATPISGEEHIGHTVPGPTVIKRIDLSIGMDFEASSIVLNKSFSVSAVLFPDQHQSTASLLD